MISVHHKGDFSTSIRFLTKLLKSDYRKLLDRYGQMGVDALKAATPADTGNTANCWNYEIQDQKGSVVLRWYNTNVNKGVNIAIILQMGHGTRNGGYVQGRDYINPALRPIFDELATAAWNEVTKG